MKYKKCCWLKDKIVSPEIPDEVMNKIQEFQREEMERERQYGKTRPIIHFNHHGHKLVAVGSQINWAKEEKWKTFPDFLMDYIKNTLGPDWGNAELKKPYNDRHQILQWYHQTCLFQQAQIPGPNGIYDSVPNGFFAAYLSLSYDLYTLRHHKLLQQSIISRLKLKDQFQGARYELFVITTCIRAGFDIKLENENDRSRKHPEFIATHKETGQFISVEAKSKHREGVLGFPGKRKADEEVRLRLGGLINDALKKENSRPLIIFVDANIPPSVAVQMEIRPPNLLSRVLDQIKKTDCGRDKFNLIVFTRSHFKTS